MPEQGGQDTSGDIKMDQSQLTNTIVDDALSGKAKAAGNSMCSITCPRRLLDQSESSKTKLAPTSKMATSEIQRLAKD